MNGGLSLLPLAPYSFTAQKGKFYLTQPFFKNVTPDIQHAWFLEF